MKESQLEIHGSAVRISGHTLHIPGYSLIRKIGQGANAVVFEANDDQLKRRVAVKIWNDRGVSRAQFESIKIAGMNHPCIVSTYRFDTVEDHPFCVMEMVDGASGKEWVKSHPSTEARLHVWNLYSSALRYIHDLGQVHGDPHLGNILVGCTPTNAHYGPTAMAGGHLTVKVADAGTSEFWTDHSKIEAREGALILETADRLFAPECFGGLWMHPPGLDHRKTLAMLQAPAKYFELMNRVVDYDRRSGNAQILADLIVSSPFFDLNVVLDQIKTTGITTRDRFARRLNASLNGIGNPLDADDEINSETLERYAAAAAKHLAVTKA